VEEEEAHDIVITGFKRAPSASFGQVKKEVDISLAQLRDGARGRAFHSFAWLSASFPLACATRSIASCYSSAFDG
jgi:hypothetical protein